MWERIRYVFEVVQPRLAYAKKLSIAIQFYVTCPLRKAVSALHFSRALQGLYPLKISSGMLFTVTFRSEFLQSMYVPRISLENIWICQSRDRFSVGTLNASEPSRRWSSHKLVNMLMTSNKISIISRDHSSRSILFSEKPWFWAWSSFKSLQGYPSRCNNHPLTYFRQFWQLVSRYCSCLMPRQDAEHLKSKSMGGCY